MRSLTQPSQDLVQDYPDLRLPESLAKSHMLGESFRTIEHESAAPRSFSTMGLLASSYAFQCRRNVVDGVIKRPFKCVFLAPGRRIPSLMHAIRLCESEVILNCGIDIHSAIGDSHYYSDYGDQTLEEMMLLFFVLGRATDQQTSGVFIAVVSALRVEISQHRWLFLIACRCGLT